MTDAITVYDESYPTRRLLELIGDKWTPIIVYILGQGTKRYGELQRHLPDVSKKMLTQTLRALERDGLLKRKVYAEVPPRVENT
jgi:DNA-binding HxlR family transcriptional regulator